MLIGLGSLFWICNSVNPNYQQEAADPVYSHEAMQQLTDVIVHDIFSPPVAYTEGFLTVRPFIMVLHKVKR